MSLKRKHLAALLHGMTANRLKNLVLCEAERIARCTRPRSQPYIATIDLSSACNLHCPGCPTGNGTPGRHRTNLTVKHLSRFLAEAGDYLLIAHLYNWGEPLLNPNAPECISLLKNRKIYSSVSSHLSFSKADRLKGCIDAGLDHLIVSLDAACPATYGKYRRGGDFDLVVRNLREVIEWKRNTGISIVIEWQFVVFGHNRHELPAARKIAKEIGVDSFTALPAYGSASSNQTRPCSSLWRNIVLQADGGLSACCKTFVRKDDFGRLEDGITAFRNGPRSIQARQLNIGSARSGDIPVDHPCLRCPMTPTRHLADLSFPKPLLNEGFQVMGLTGQSNNEKGQ